jgi:hypothetical protein
MESLLRIVLGISFPGTILFATIATLNRKPDVPYFPGGFEKPSNILFRPHQLTEVGLQARKLCFISMACFLFSLAGLIVIGILKK